jgi:hypothetical protein
MERKEHAMANQEDPKDATPSEDPKASDGVNLDDDDIVHPRGKVTGKGGTWEAEGGDSGKLGPPSEILSDRNGPSDPNSRK